MDFELSEDQVALRDAAASLLVGACSSARVREVADSARHRDDALWAAMAEQGWPAVDLPEEVGGLGLGLVEVAVLCEQLGRHLAPVPFAGTVVTQGAMHAASASGALEELAGESRRALGGVDAAEWARRLSRGEATGAVAWSRRVDAVAARRDDDGTWRLTGRSDPVVEGPLADVLLVFAETGGGPAVFALVAGEAGTRPRDEPAMDRTRSIGWLELDDRPALWLGDDRFAGAVLDRALVAVCAEMLGAADVVLAMTVQYAQDRVQFGRPIGGFQAVKHRCADMLVDVEGMRSAAYYAAWAVGAGDPEAAVAASAAKVWCSDAARRVMASGLQVHGGIGFTWEHDLHLFLKRSQLDQVTFGDGAHHRERIARILRWRLEAGLPVL
ncbi:MAG TPA: acyl-CoA dehydrogenase family protein [Acidimicrobiales bacterium]|nr:acyl-CoA dehydrogenase family protein [Acidimicrobiales bacterium]